MENGERLHAEIAHYLTTGEKLLSGQVLSGMHMIPEPGPDLLVEHDIVPTLTNGKSGLDIAPLRANGVPLVGAIDLIHKRGTNKGTEEIEEMRDPEGTVEVLDWKTCRTLNNIKRGPELLKSIQMSGYGKYIFETMPDAKFVRLSHGYFPAQGAPKKTTIRVDRDQIENSWEHANRVASSICEAAKETDPDRVDANTEACNSYGRECPAASVCTARKRNALSKFVGNVLSEQIIPAENLTKQMSGSIFSQIKNRANTPSNPPTTTGRSIFDKEKEKEKEVPPFPASSSTGVTEGDSDRVAKLKAELARLEAQERAAKGMPELLPPDAPESNPILAALPDKENSFTRAMATVPSEVPVVDTRTVISEMVAETPPAPKKRGRKPKAPVVEPESNPEPEPVNPLPEVTYPAEVEVPPVVEDPIALPIPGKINFYVNCTPESGAESLWPLVDHLILVMNTEAKVRDVRLAEDDRFTYGRWKGILAGMIHQTPLDPGNYQLMHAHGDVAQVVVETMRIIARQSGGEVVIGGA